MKTQNNPKRVPKNASVCKNKCGSNWHFKNTTCPKGGGDGDFTPPQLHFSLNIPPARDGVTPSLSPQTGVRVHFGESSEALDAMVAAAQQASPSQAKPETVSTEKDDDIYSMDNCNNSANKNIVGYTGDVSKFTPKKLTSPDAIKLRNGLFVAASRTYGERYIEPIIRSIYGYSKPESSDFDALDKTTDEKFEIKSARVLKTKTKVAKNLFDKIISEVDEDPLRRIVSFSDRKNEKYDANIQNVKRDHFDSLIYILLYDEGIEVFKVKKGLINKDNIKNWSDKHGRYDELGKSGQFNINSGIIEYHEKNHFDRFISYEDIIRIAKGIE